MNRNENWGSSMLDQIKGAGRRRGTWAGAFALAGILAVASSAARGADEYVERRGEEYHKDYILGAPDDASEAWLLSNGGRIYDKWWVTLDTAEPRVTHPSYPKEGKQKGAATWRCKECHGWDYKGAAGKYGKGSHFTGIKGVMGMAGQDAETIHKILMNDTHQFTEAMIPHDAMRRVSLFISRGLHNADDYIDKETGKVKGDAEKGAALFQNSCAACHGFKGTALDWGEEGEPAYVGTEANGNPWEILHKIINGHPGVEMIALRPFGIEDAVDVLTYAQGLPTK